jgi:hypothetical protein
MRVIEGFNYRVRVLAPVAAQVAADAGDDQFLLRGFERARRRHDPAEGK